MTAITQLFFRPYGKHIPKPLLSVHNYSNLVIMVRDPYAKKLFYFLLAGSKGGPNRIKIISIIQNTPMNANQLAKELGLDYKAIQHHLRVLEKNNLVTKVGDKYGATFFLSNFLELNMDSYNEIIEKLEKSK